MWRTLLTGYQYVLLVYFSLLNILYALFSCIGLRAIVVVFAREFSQGSLRDLLERDVYKPVSILVPAHNEEVSIVGFRGPPADRYLLTPVPTGRQTMRRATAVLVLAAMLAIGGPAVSGAAAHESHSRYWKARVPPSMAVYEWHNAGDLAPAEVQRRLRFLRANGFRTIYLDIGKYFDAADASNQTLVRALRGQIRRFVATAAGYGLSVQALGGGPDWFGEPRGELGPTLVTLVASYNSHVDQRERLAGVHLDLEPYTEDSWRDPANVRANAGLYLTTIAEIVGAYRAALGTRGNRNLQLGLAIPFWFDGSSEEVPDDIDFRHDDDPDPNPKPVAFHVIALVADLPGAYLVIMAYRWFTGTSNGSIALARDEFRYAAQAGARSGLVVGQRYSPVPPEGDPEEAITTFHGLPRWRFWRAAAEIALAFRRYPQFRGLSVDDVEAFMDARP